MGSPLLDARNFVVELGKQRSCLEECENESASSSDPKLKGCHLFRDQKKICRHSQQRAQYPAALSRKALSALAAGARRSDSLPPPDDRLAMRLWTLAYPTHPSDWRALPQPLALSPSEPAVTDLLHVALFGR